MNHENLESLAKIAGIALICFTFYVNAFELRNKTGNKIREDYKFAKDFFEEREKNPDLHKFVVELGYLGITHDRRIKPEVVEYLLSLQKPAIALFWFKKARRYLDFSITNIDQKITFKSKYKRENSREIHKLKYLSLYWISFFLASYRFLFQTALPLSPLNDYKFLALWVFFWLILAWDFLKAYVDMDIAENLLGLQSGNINIKNKKGIREFRKNTFGWINKKLGVVKKDDRF